MGRSLSNLKRIFDKELIQNTLDKNSEYFDEGFNTSEWLSDLDNIAIINSDKDVALFEHIENGLYQGHYFFNEAKGRKAIELGTNIIKLLLEDYSDKVRVVQGLTPVDNRKARWVSRQLGFNSLGIVTTEEGECELFFLPLMKERVIKEA